MSDAEAAPLLMMKFAWVGETRAPPSAAPFRPARSTRAPADAGMSFGTSAADGAPAGPGRSRPGLQSRHAVIERPTHQPVDVHRRVHPDTIGTELLHLSATWPDHEPANSAVADEHVGTPAEHRDRGAKLMG